jgi:2-succinyl-6-hydroxy-2,4-cyclohexadiene-1-carboxylate synthase
MVHGLMAGRALWSANIEALRTVATPVVVELLGHGRSPSPADASSYRPDAYVAQFESLRADLGVERWLLIGQSLGATLTLRYALDHPDRIIGHVITNSISALAERIGDDAAVEATAQRIEALGRAGLVANRLNPARARRIVDWVRESLAADQHLLDPAAIAAAVRYTAHGSSQRRRVAENRVRTLVVSGTREAAFDEPCRHAEVNMPFVEIVRLDASHAPNAEVPALFNDAAISFIEQL